MYLWWSLCRCTSGGVYVDVPLVEFMYLEFARIPGEYLWWSLCTCYLYACQVRVTVGDPGLCCCTCVRYFGH